MVGGFVSQATLETSEHSRDVMASLPAAKDAGTIFAVLVRDERSLHLSTDFHSGGTRPSREGGRAANYRWER